MKTMLLAVVALSLGGTAAFAQPLTGTTVTGVLNFPSYSVLNYFDPANGFVPGGYANVSSPTVTITGPSTAFGFQDTPPGNLDVATFSGTQLTVTDVPSGTGIDLAWQMTFTDSAFSGVTLVSDNFPYGGLSESLVGDQITLSWAGGSVSDGDSFTAVYNVASSVPEPGGETTIGLVGLAAAGLGRLKRRKMFAR